MSHPPVKVVPGEAPAVTEALRDVVFDGQWAVHERVRAAVAAVVRPVRSDESHRIRTRLGYRQLREVVVSLGPSSAVAGDGPTVFALFDWSAVAAPDLFPLLSGHFSLVVGAVQRLGDATAEQRRALARLEDAGHVGVLLLTELGYGSNVVEMRTEARWDPGTRRFTLHTPVPEACKFMPNVADETVAKTCVVAARLMVNGQDEGVFPFVLTLRDDRGLVRGVSVHRMPDKGFCPMDNAMIRFEDVSLPEGALLTGGIAHFDERGEFHCDRGEPRDRFMRSTEQLQIGRVALSSGALAAARSGAWLMTRYARQRHTAHRIPMIERDNVRLPLARTVARLYAATALGNLSRRRLADLSGPDLDSDAFELGMLAKPMLSTTALSALQEFRERLGAQGMFRTNMITDYLGITQAVITAEGDNQMLEVAVGRALARAGAPPLPPVPEGGPAWMTMLDHRARSLAAAGPTHGGYAAVRVARATAAALAAHALHDAATTTAGTAGELLHTLAGLYATDQILEHAAWHTAEGRLTAADARELLDTRDELAVRLAPALEVLVDAFGVGGDLLPSAHVDVDYQDAWIRDTGWTWQ
ncbi:acyl-CoA dehydrogenase family protein [Streptomyces flaveolus]|uniref:acyl-CoA dehydrogenase family protein n=1 Tax=Streptomyces flaveolus TaxID=67297 RepID=UPI0033FF3BB5